MMNIAAEMAKAEISNIEIAVEQVNALNAKYRGLISQVPNLYNAILASAKADAIGDDCVAFCADGVEWYIANRNNHVFCRGRRFPYTIEDEFYTDANPFNNPKLEELKRLKAAKEKAIQRNLELERTLSLLKKAIA